jgi:multiple sugar transport system substrate-binding protein
MKSFFNLKYWGGRSPRGRVALAAVVVAGVALAAPAVSAATAKSSSKPLIVWIDTSRVPYEQAYMKANPGANIKWVIYNGNENGTGVLQSKFALWNRIGWPSSAPDVMFDTQNYDAVQLATAPYNDLLNLKKYVPASVLKGFAGNSLSACTTPSGQVICLRNDSAADVLWVNQGLYTKLFGSKPVPTTWAGIVADGQALRKSHKSAGYIVGDIGDEFDDDFIYWGNGCPLNEVVGPNTVEISPNSSACTKFDSLFDKSGLEGNAITDTYVFAAGGFPAAKVVMMVGPLWYGTAVFENGKKAPDGVPNGTMAAYPPPKSVLGKSITGALGGGLWLVSKHSSQPAAAAAFAEYMATSPNIQAVGVDAGLPDYAPDQAAYVTALGAVFANPVSTGKAWEEAAAEIWKGWGPTPWSTDSAWASTVVPGVTHTPPSTLGAEINSFALALANDARLAGWTVKSSSKCINTDGGSGC